MLAARADVVVIGGGIAGLAAAAQFAARGVQALLLEHEPWLAGHASGRNAAIFRPLEDDATTATLCAGSERFLTEQLGVMPIERVGLLLAASGGIALDALQARATQAGLALERLDATALRACAPATEGGELATGLLVPSGGVLDTHAILQGLARVARDGGAQLWLQASVQALEQTQGRLSAVTLADGRRIACEQVVIAAGAFGQALGRSVGSRVVLTPVRRHLVQLDSSACARGGPIVWRVGAARDEVYFRAESGGVLASPCDERVVPPGEPEADPGAAELLARKLARSAPRLQSARVRRAWACLRTFASDRELLVGRDPDVPGLLWLAGLGGRGMGVAVGAAAELVAIALGEVAPLTDTLSPTRPAARQPLVLATA